MMTDLRWFAPNRFCTLVVPALRARGFRIDLEGEEPAALAVAMDGQCAVAGYEYARRHRCPLLLYLWDLPPWRLGTGSPEMVFEWRQRIRRVPRVIGGYQERSGYYSRIRYVARRAATVWTPSRLTAADLAARFGVEAEVVPFCYDSERFQPGEWRPSEPPRLLVVSRLVPHKNQLAVLRAAARLAPPATVRCIGQGPLAAGLADAARDLGITLALETNWPSDAAVRQAYRDATVVVAPSRFEGFGLCPMEGVASGIPTVASDIEPHREHLGDSVSYFGLEDESSLVVAIRTAMERGPADPRGIAGCTIEAAADRFAIRLERMLADSQ